MQRLSCLPIAFHHKVASYKPAIYTEDFNSFIIVINKAASLHIPIGFLRVLILRAQFSNHAMLFDETIIEFFDTDISFKKIKRTTKLNTNVRQQPFNDVQGQCHVINKLYLN